MIQFSVKHEQNIDCGGGYVKLFDCSLDQKDMHGETPYEIMFGKLKRYVFHRTRSSTSTLYPLKDFSQMNSVESIILCRQR